MPKRNKKVFIVEPYFGCDHIFKARGWEVVDSIKGADLLQFTGGGDINPALYGQVRHKTTYPSEARDAREVVLARLALKDNRPVAGICRGGQLLNALLGGSMWQDVDNHDTPHDVVELETGEVFISSSTHHQMMIPHKSGKVVLMGAKSTIRRRMPPTGTHEITTFYTRSKNSPKNWDDVEAIAYEEQNAFCIQGHPEYRNFDDFTDKYFDYLRRYLTF